MTQYQITMSSSNGEYEVVLQGPGLGQTGKQYVFRNTERCQTFIDAVNFAYQQGLRDGARGVRPLVDERRIVVSGATPETLVLRCETWWERLSRRWVRESAR